MTVLVALGVGLVIGLLMGALGGGGSILTVPVLVYLLDQSAQDATSTSLVIVGITAVVAAIGHARAGHTQWRTGVLLAVAGVPASLLATLLNRRVDGDVVLLAFSALMLVAAAGMLARNPGPDDAADHGGAAGGTWLRGLAAGLLIGALTGFFGVGGGFIIVPVLVVALGFGMADAVGTSLVVIALNSAVALGARSTGGLDLDPVVVVPFTLAAVAAALLGQRVADRVSGPALTRSFGALLVVVAVYVGVQAVLGLR